MLMIFKIFPISIIIFLSGQSNAGPLIPPQATAQNLTSSLPEVNYDYWSVPDINFSNNCYNYATNRAEGSWAQPGEASGAKYTTITCNAVYAAAAQDWGLVPTKYYSLDENKEETLIALVVNPGIDFHWYRRGPDNKWSHKLNLQVLETDSSGNIIYDPVIADRGRYRDFCGYFKVKNYLAFPQQQNAGYVRIGKMKDWPQYLNIEKVQADLTKKSTVVLQFFSGRQNPIFSLQGLLKDSTFAEILARVSKVVRDTPAFSEQKTMSLQKNLQIFRPILGSNSIFIIDSEGIVFPRGSVIEFQDKFIKVVLENREPIILESLIAADLRRHLMNLEALTKRVK